MLECQPSRTEILQDRSCSRYYLVNEKCSDLYANVDTDIVKTVISVATSHCQPRFSDMPNVPQLSFIGRCRRRNIEDLRPKQGESSEVKGKL